MLTRNAFDFHVHNSQLTTFKHLVTFGEAQGPAVPQGTGPSGEGVAKEEEPSLALRHCVLRTRFSRSQRELQVFFYRFHRSEFLDPLAL